MLCVLPSVVLLQPDSGLNCLNHGHLLVPMWHFGFPALDTEHLCNFWHDQLQLGNQWISGIYSYHPCAMKVQSMFLVSVYLLGLLICFCPSDTVWGFFTRIGLSAPYPNPKHGELEYLSLSGNSLDTCLPQVALPAARLLLAWYFQFIHLGRGRQQLSDKIMSLSLDRAYYGTTLAHVSC